MKTCLQCGNPVPVYTADYKYADGTVFHRTGDYMGGTWMKAHDEHRNFCTMRCAARYGIKAANMRGRQ